MGRHVVLHVLPLPSDLAPAVRTHETVVASFLFYLKRVLGGLGSPGIVSLSFCLSVAELTATGSCEDSGLDGPAPFLLVFPLGEDMRQA